MRRLALLAGLLGLAPLLVFAAPASAHTLIGGNNYYYLENFDYSQPINWDTYQQTDPKPGVAMYAWVESPFCCWRYYVHTGTDQRYDLIDASGNYTALSPAWNNSKAIMEFQSSGSGTWQQWRSENTSHGWLIWSVWFHNAYPNWCAAVGYPHYEAVVTTNSLDGQMTLACPEGGVPGSVWGEGQYWAANQAPIP